MADILVVNASKMCRELLAQILEVHGYVTSRASLEEAVAALQQSLPALVILEPGPLGTAGWTVLAKIRNGGNGATAPPVVIVSDQAGKPEVLAAANLGVRDFVLKKDFSLAELLMRVRRHVAPKSEPAIAKIKQAIVPKAVVAPMTRPPMRVAVQPSTEVRRVVEPGPRVAPSDNRRAVLDAAREMGLTLLTREQTLEQLDLAPLKTLPGVVAELISLASSPRGTVTDIAQILRRDPVLTARILRVANSAGFTTQRARISTVEDAVKNIGIAGVRNMVVNVGVFDAFTGDGCGNLRMTRVWQHCLGVAMVMEKLAPQDGSVPSGSAYLVGLCHDLADIVLRQHFSAAYDAIGTLIGDCGCAIPAAQAAVFGLPYSELMKQLLTRLRLPPLITAPIEEFFDRADRKGASGAGSVLVRLLRALNVYAHGLLLAPGPDEPITPLTRAECDKTFGEAMLSQSDDEELRAQAMATASVLAGLSSAQTQQMCEPLVPQQSIRVGYSRHHEYAKLDPLAAFMRLAAREVEMLPPMGSVMAHSLADMDALIVAGPRSSAAETVAQDLDSIRRLIAKQPMPVLYLGEVKDGSGVTVAQGVTVRKLPLAIDSLGEYLAIAAADSRGKAMAA